MSRPDWLPSLVWIGFDTDYGPPTMIPFRDMDRARDWAAGDPHRYVLSLAVPNDVIIHRIEEIPRTVQWKQVYP